MRSLFFGFMLAFLFSVGAGAQDLRLKDDLVLKYLVHLPTKKTANPPVVVLLHGYGSNEADLFDLKQSLPEDFLIVSVRAPKQVNANGYEWYEMSHANGHHDGNKEDMLSSTALMVKFIGQIVARYHANPKEVYLAGFSQGAMMCYCIGLNHPQMVKGIAPIGGMIVPFLRSSVKPSPALKNLRVFAGHGTADEKIPFEDCKSAIDFMKSLGMAPELHAYPGTRHQITKAIIEDVSKWLMQ